MVLQTNNPILPLQPTGGGYPHPVEEPINRPLSAGKADETMDEGSSEEFSGLLETTAHREPGSGAAAMTPASSDMPDMFTTPNLGATVESVPLEEREDAQRISEEEAAVAADDEADRVIEETAPSMEQAAVVDDAQAAKDPLLVEVEAVISEDLDKIYVNLPEDKRAAFKESGEMLARTVAGYLRKGKLPRVKVLKAVRWWLRMIPHTNIHFLEQKAKILLDGIIKMTEQEGG